MTTVTFYDPLETKKLLYNKLTNKPLGRRGPSTPHPVSKIGAINLKPKFQIAVKRLIRNRDFKNTTIKSASAFDRTSRWILDTYVVYAHEHLFENLFDNRYVLECDITIDKLFGLDLSINNLIDQIMNCIR